MKELMHVKLSVIMSVKDGDIILLNQAVESVLRQTLADFEFLIMNDGSTNPEIISYLEELPRRESRIKVFRQENSGLAKSLNALLDLAKGEFCARMDGDDIALPDRFKKQIGYLNDNPKVGVVGTKCLYVNDRMKPVFVTKYSNSFSPARFQKENPIVHSSVMFRTQLIKSVGGYIEQFNGDEDRCLWYCVSEKADIIIIPEVLQIYRVSNTALSFRKAVDLCKIEWLVTRCMYYRQKGIGDSKEKALIDYSANKKLLDRKFRQDGLSKMASRAILIGDFVGALNNQFSSALTSPFKLREWIKLVALPYLYFIRGWWWWKQAFIAAQKIECQSAITVEGRMEAQG